MTSDDKITIITNNQPRLILDAYELTPDEREQFDYIDWSAIDAGEESASFVRYMGQLYDVGDFMLSSGGHFEGWDGYLSDSFFSGILIRFSEDGDYAVMGRFYA